MIRLRPWLIVGAAVVLAGALVWLILSEHRARAEGTEIKLALGGVDPRSLLSGHYVQLLFTDSLPNGVTCSGRAWNGKADKPKWVAMRVTDGRARVAGEAPTREAALRLAPIAVRGNVNCWGARTEAENVTLDIGLDRFHVSQKEAQAMERALRASTAETPTAFALVSVGKDGRARLKGVEVDGRRVMLDWFSPAA